MATLEREWMITVGATFSDATEAYVAEVTTVDGKPAVLKLIVPRDANAGNEITVLRLADGDGCVRLLRDDVVRGALLMERLGRSLHALGLPVRQRREILCELAAGLAPRTRRRPAHRR